MQGPHSLNDLSVGEVVQIQEIHTAGGMRRRLQDLGFIKGAQVECVQRSPLGDPTAFFIRGAVVALRAEDASQILVARI